MNSYDVINIMQKYLIILRKIAGWTMEDLGRCIGVTKQTISNLENNKVSMTKTQYLALRTIFEYEIRVVDDNIVLKRVMSILFYDKVIYGIEKERQIYEAMENIAAAASGGISGSQLSMMAVTLLAPLKLPGGIGMGTDLTESPYEWVGETMEESFDAEDRDMV